jgi:DNA-binding beta-propeller fold protein YncE
MSLRRVGGLAAIAVATMLWMSCGDVYRPVVIPISITPPNSSNFHAVFAVTADSQANPGAAFQIDVSGDTNIGQATLGINPTHAAALPNKSRIFVASAGSLFPGESDVVTAFTPAPPSTIATGLGFSTTFTFPNLGPNQISVIGGISEVGNAVTLTVANSLSQAQVGGQIVISGVTVSGTNPNGYNGSFIISAVNGNSISYVNTVTGLPAGSGGTASIPLPSFCSYQPDFLTTTETNVMYVANFGVENGPNCSFSSTDSVAKLSTTSNSIANIVYLPAGSHPVGLVETPNAQNLYVLNQGLNNVTNLSPTDLSALAAPIAVGTTPVWAVARGDSQRVYVLTQGSGALVPIDTTTNSILPSQTNLSVGAGANFMLYDPHLNRLYVTNPSNGNVYIFSTTGGVDLSGVPNDTPTLLATISMTGGTNPPCSAACSPSAVAALPDGSRFYVASYEIEGPSKGTTCPDPNVGPAFDCVIPRLTVFDALSMTVKPAPASASLLSPSLSLLGMPAFSGTQYAVPAVSACAPAATYSPGTTRFRMFTTAAADSSHVYVGMCDSGAVADIRTATNTISTGNNSPDTLVSDIPAPFGICSGGSCAAVATITGYSITSNQVTFQAINSFTPGTKVAISGLSSTAGVPLNGQTLTVLAVGLSATQFTCNLSQSQSDVGATSDTGTAVPIAPPQAPIFLLTGQ